MVCGYLKIETFGKTTNEHVDITSSVFIGQGSGAQDRKVGNARQWSARPFVCLRGQLKNQSQATIEGRISLYDSIIERRFPLYPFQTHRDHKILQRHNIFPRLWNFKCCIPLQWIGHALTSSVSLYLLFRFLLFLFAFSQRNPNQDVVDPRLRIFHWLSFVWDLWGLCFGVIRLRHFALGLSAGTTRLRSVVWSFGFWFFRLGR